MTDKRMACPHCQRLLVPSNFSRHEPTCVYRPEQRERIAVWFRTNAVEKAGVRYTPAQNLYVTRATAERLPSLVRLMAAVGGDWMAICQFFVPDLVPHYLKAKVQTEYRTGLEWQETTLAELQAIAEENDGDLPPLDGLTGITYRNRLDKYGYWRFCLENGLPMPQKNNGGTPEWKRLDDSGERPPVRDDEMEAAEYAGLGLRVSRSYQAVYRRGGQSITETRHVLR